ncbi:type VI secretion system Vgr family protein [Massilia sp. TSP1-1-2]|uniref:type VI secretion system Vgr family protein n=1 Tax=Massilia sp. TSP1-1-2 TaxID=2804649 RepID=UPI003CEFC94B
MPLARQVSVTSALATDVLLFKSMSTTEALGRLPEFRVQLLSKDSEIKIADVLGKAMSIELLGGLGEGERHFHGIVTRFGSTGWSGEFATYEATIHPWLWLLKKSANCRIFQDLKVTDIVKKVCAVYGGLVSLSLDSLSGEYPVLPYCVQYRESDFDFVCRLLEDAGIYFYFTHTADAHTMVLADSHNAHELIPGYGSLKYAVHKNPGELEEEAIYQWSAGGEIQSSSYVLNDFDFEKTAASNSAGLLTTRTIAALYQQEAFEMFDYPGAYTDADVGKALALARIERLHGQCEQIEAQTDARGLFAGGVFAMADHPRDEQNRKYLVTSARLEIGGGQYRSGEEAQPFTVLCQFTAIGNAYPYRPSATVTKPIVQGPQTAMVVGKAGEEIWTDKYGRIKVQFHWDRLGKEDENSSCWVRVSQAWAGKGWGAMAVPRIGMEVIVSFLEGDPDRPLVTGCVYNSDAMPPYALPAEQTKATFKTNTSKGGGGFNELRFEDKKGAEEIFIQAERDCNRIVKNNDTLKVGFEVAKKGDQTIDIKNDQAETIGNDQTLKVGNDRNVTVTHDETVKVDNNQTITIKVDQKLDVGANQTVSIGADQETAITGKQKVDIGSTLVIEAGTSILLKVGGSSIKIEAAKITIKSAEIEISADANAKLKAGAMMEVKAGAIMTVEGAMVKIN